MRLVRPTIPYKRTFNGNRRIKPGMIVLEIFTIILFLLFMFPFGMVVLNSAKTSQEIIFNAIALPSDWGQLWTNVVRIFTNKTVDYMGAFIDSVIITVLSLLVIVLFSSMAAWILVRNHKAWSTFIFMTFVASMVIPFQVLMYPLVRWMWILGDFLHISLLSSIHGLVLPTSALARPFPFLCSMVL